MKSCTYRLSLDELLNQPSGLLVLRGADGENESGEPNGSSEETGEDDKSKSGEGKEDEKGKKAAPDAKDRRIAGLEEEKERHARLRQEAVAETKTLKLQIAKLEKDGTPDDALKTSNDELTTSNASLTETNQKLMLQIAFLTEAGFDWVDPDAAMRLADLSDVEFDEKTSKAVGLNAALTKLVKDKPYLLKAKATDDEDDSKKPRRTGTPPKPGSAKDADAAAAQAKLRQKYPALRRG